jgi:hypothetical protein
MLPNTTKIRLDKPKELAKKLQVKDNILFYIVLAVVVLGAFLLMKK